MSKVALPFLTLSDEAVSLEGWMVGAPGEPLYLASDILEGWDYEQDIQVRAELRVDFELAARDLDIPVENLRLAVVLRAGTGAGNHPRRSDMIYARTLDAGNPACFIESIIQGQHLSGRLLLDLRVLLEAPVAGGGALSPKNRGSRLWDTRKNILIEDGGAARFPVELVSFSESFNGRPEQDAPWYLDWMPRSLGADFSGSVRLYVNADQPVIAERFEQADAVTLQAMIADAMSQLLDAALAFGEDWTVEVHEAGTVGWQATAWMEMAFPGKSFAEVRDIKAYFPGRYRAAILAAAEIGGES